MNNQSIYSATSAIIAQQKRLDTIANNLANINTVGFKGNRMDFKESLYVQLNAQQPAAEGPVMRGHGVQEGLTRRSFAPGAMQQTGRKSDVAIAGDGFFSVMDAQGNVRYTRDGMFNVSLEPKPDAEEENAMANYLVTSQGNYVLDENGSKIEIFGDISKMTIAESGEITFADINGNVNNIDPNADVTQETIPITKLSMVDFINPSGLEAVGSNLYAQTAMSGTPEPTTGASAMQGTLEGSNVDMGTEMTRLMRTQRAMSLASRALTTADEMDAKVNQLRG